jgi:hypothetical protein
VAACNTHLPTAQPSFFGGVECAQLACAGLRPNFRFPVVGLQGTRVGSKCRSAARAETTGYARADRRVFDSQPRGRLG